MEYTFIRNDHSEKKEIRYEYRVIQLPELVAHTNYRRNINKAKWCLKYKDEYRLEQTNKSINDLKSIPVIGTIANMFYYRKYSLFINDANVGYADQVVGKFKLRNASRVVRNNREFVVDIGNSFVIRPLKNYEWYIKREQQIIATITHKSNDNKYKIQTEYDDIIEIIILLTMIQDAKVFANPTPVFY